MQLYWIAEDLVLLCLSLSLLLSPPLLRSIRISSTHRPAKHQRFVSMSHNGAYPFYGPPAHSKPLITGAPNLQNTLAQRENNHDPAYQQWLARHGNQPAQASTATAKPVPSTGQSGVLKKTPSKRDLGITNPAMNIDTGSTFKDLAKLWYVFYYRFL